MHPIAHAESSARIIAEFVPQAWINGYAVGVDTEGPVKFDVTDAVLMLGRVAALALRDDDYDTDNLRFSSNAPNWVRDWSGPFYVRVAEAIQDYYACQEQL
jgi:hypothetical protein